MAGTIVHLFSMRSFDFTNVSANGQVDLVAVKGIDASSYREGTLLVRVHSGTVGGSATITVRAAVYAPTPEDPSQNNNFVGDVVATATIDSTAATNAPSLARANLTSNFGGQLLIAVCGNQDTSPQTISAVLSAELVLKN